MAKVAVFVACGVLIALLQTATGQTVQSTLQQQVAIGQQNPDETCFKNCDQYQAECNNYCNSQSSPNNQDKSCWDQCSNSQSACTDACNAAQNQTTVSNISINQQQTVDANGNTNTVVSGINTGNPTQTNGNVTLIVNGNQVSANSNSAGIMTGDPVSANGNSPGVMTGNAVQVNDSSQTTSANTPSGVFASPPPYAPGDVIDVGAPPPPPTLTPPPPPAPATAHISQPDNRPVIQTTTTTIASNTTTTTTTTYAPATDAQSNEQPNGDSFVKDMKMGPIGK